MQPAIASALHHPMITIAGVAALIAVVSGVAERRRSRRTNLDRVGFMPWTLLSIMATMIALISSALAMKN